MEDLEVGEFLQRFAPDDVRATIAWLTANGYILSFHRGEGTFGAEFVYVVDGEGVQAAVDGALHERHRMMWPRTRKR